MVSHTASCEEPHYHEISTHSVLEILHHIMIPEVYV